MRPEPRGLYGQRFAAIDLGTNNCRLLVAAPQRDGFRIVDAFSRIVRLGEGAAGAGRLSDEAMNRAVDALKVCAEKIARRNVTRARCIATQACRGAENGAAFLSRVREETGLAFDVITPEEEASLAVRGCAPLIDPDADAVLVFDIGGGSTELSWVDRRASANGPKLAPPIAAWTSFPFGVVTLSERYGGQSLTRARYEEIVAMVAGEVSRFDGANALKPAFEAGRAHLLGTSGTVTSIAGVFLGLSRYMRSEVDGLWLARADAAAVSERLRAMDYEARKAEPCIGEERADLVVAGCAILEGVLRVWPSERIRVADRGLREGILAGLIDAARKKRRRRRRPKRKSPPAS